MSATRSPEEIRRSIEEHRVQLGRAVERLRTEVSVVTDWRRQINDNRTKVLVGAAVAGFLVGGGVAAVTGIFRRRS